MNITSAQTDQIIQAAKAEANLIGVPMNIAIVDQGANLKAFYRMNDALLGCADIAIKKAKTSRWFNLNSGELGKLSQPGGPLYGIEHANGGLISFAGGILLKNNQGEIIGAIGVSGGTVNEDDQVAQSGAAGLQLS